jgi:hypothetical protein
MKRIMVAICLFAVQPTIYAKGSSYPEAPSSGLAKAKPCMWQASDRTWIDLNSVVRLGADKKEVVIYRYPVQI